MGSKVKACCVPGCDDKITRRYGVPKCDVLRKMWLKRIGNEKLSLQESNYHLLKNYRVCGNHFDNMCKNPNESLLKNSLPTLNLPHYHGPSNRETCFLEAEQGVHGYITPEKLREALTSALASEELANIAKRRRILFPMDELSQEAGPSTARDLVSSEVEADFSCVTPDLQKQPRKIYPARHKRGLLNVVGATTQAVLSPDAKGKRECGVKGCQRARNSGGHFFPNPEHDPDMFSLWLRLTGNPQLKNDDPKAIYKKYRICSKHFSRNDYRPNGFLKEKAYPSIYLPNNVQSCLSDASASISGTLPDHSYIKNVPQEESSVHIPDVSNSHIFSTEYLDDTCADSIDIPLNDEYKELEYLHLYHEESLNSYLPENQVINWRILDKPIQYDRNIILNENNETNNCEDTIPNVDHYNINQDGSVECLKFQITDSTLNLKQLETNNKNTKETEIVADKPLFRSVKSYLQDSNCITDVCRICFTCLIDTEEVIKLYEDSPKYKPVEIKNMLSTVLPDLDLELYSDNVICLKCFEVLVVSYQLQTKWLETKEKLLRIIKEKHSIIRRDTDLIIVGQKAKTKIQNWHLKDHDYTNKLSENSEGINVADSVVETYERQHQVYLDDVQQNLNNNSLDRLQKTTKKRRYTRKKPEVIWGVGPYLCELCGAKYERIKSMKRHLWYHTVPGKLKSKKILKKEPTFMCDLCGRLFFSAKILARHGQQHEEYKCTSCEKIFNTLSRLNYHIKSIHTKNCYQCDICGKQFSYLCSLRHHGVIHNPQKKTIPCKICNKKFVFPSQLRKHVRSHISDKLLKCEYCGKSIKREDTLKKHMEIYHLGKGKCVCLFCNRAYWKKSTLKLHYIRVHRKLPDGDEFKNINVTSNIQCYNTKIL